MAWAPNSDPFHSQVQARLNRARAARSRDWTPHGQGSVTHYARPGASLSSTVWVRAAKSGRAPEPRFTADTGPTVIPASEMPTTWSTLRAPRSEIARARGSTVPSSGGVPSGTVLCSTARRRPRTTRTPHRLPSPRLPPASANKSERRATGCKNAAQCTDPDRSVLRLLLGGRRGEALRRDHEHGRSPPRLVRP